MIKQGMKKKRKEMKAKLKINLTLLNQDAF